ncbi:MAG: hypothetical protein AB1664_11140 [Thermodesulfobacteriota bacterium]
MILAPQRKLGMVSLDCATAKTTNKEMAEAFKHRLVEVAGFKFVPEPLPMVNSQNAIIYYLFFASHNDTGRKIVSDIFRKYSKRVMSHVS